MLKWCMSIKNFLCLIFEYFYYFFNIFIYCIFSFHMNMFNTQFKSLIA